MEHAQKPSVTNKIKTKKSQATTYRNSNDVSNDPRVPKTKVKVYKR